MKKKENIERFLLKSLIADLDVGQEQLEFEGIEEAKTTTCTPKSLFNDNTDPLKEDNLISTISFFPSCPITYEEIVNALNNQRSTLLIQTRVRNLNAANLSLLLIELEGKLTFLMKDKNGNYLCSDIFKVCTVAQRLSIIKEIKSNLVNISIDQFGTHPIQTLIELSKTKEEIDQLLKIISTKKALISLSRNANGSYVIQKIISNIPEQQRLIFNMALLENLLILSLDMYGVCIIKKYITSSQGNLYYAISVITSNFLIIAENQYGNYLIQYLIELFWNRSELIPVKQMIVNCFVVLSSNRFASHITEKYVNMLNSIEKKMLLSILIHSGYSSILFNNKFSMSVMSKLSNHH